MICSNCGSVLPDGTKFCENCGAKLAQNEPPPFIPAPPAIVCRACGQSNDSRFELCQNCGEPLGENMPAAQPGDEGKTDKRGLIKKPSPKKSKKDRKEKSGAPSDNARTFFAAQAENKKNARPEETGAVFGLNKKPTPADRAKRKKLLATVGICAAAVIAVVILIAVFFGKKDPGEDYAVFVRESNVSIVSAHGSEVAVRELTDNYGRKDALENTAVFSEDGKTVFFIDDAGDEDGCALYYLDISAGLENGLPVRICSSLRSSADFRVTRGGDSVFFIRSDGTLCMCNLKTVVSLAEKVEDFWATESGDYTVYTSGGAAEELYELTVKTGKAELIDREVEAVRPLDDLSAVFYIKDGSVYKREKGGEKNRVAAGVADGTITDVTPSGTFYYVTTDRITMPASQLVEDDRAQSDGYMTQPEPPVYPKTSDFRLTTGTTDWDAYHAAVAKYEELSERYDKDNNEYEQKLRRDALRQELETVMVSYEKSELCYFNGSESVTVNDSGCTPLADITPDGTLIYVRPASNSVKKLILSDMHSVDEVQQMLDELGGNDGNLYIAYDGVETSAGVKAEGACTVTKDGRAVWLGSRGIWALRLEEDGQAQLLLEGGSRWYETDGGKLLLFKKTGSGYEMYLEDGKLIDENARPDGIVSKDDTVYYISGFSERTQSGALMRLSGVKTSKVEDDVYAFALTRNGNIAFLVNYSTENKRGELAMFIKNKKITVDEKVSAIVPAV